MTTTKKSKPMPKWRPSPPELVKFFEKSLKPFSEIQTRKMFGYPVAFVNSHMFAGLHQNTMIGPVSCNRTVQRFLSRCQVASCANMWLFLPPCSVRQNH